MYSYYLQSCFTVSIVSLLSIAVCLDPPDCPVRNENIGDPCGGIQSSGNSLANMLQNLHEHLCGCVYVRGNVHITVASDWSDLDTPLTESNFSFFYHIREVYAYIYLQDVPEIDRISFPNLRIIRGESLIGSGQFALAALRSDIRSLYMPQLTEITRGNIRFRDGPTVPSLCNTLSVKWADILSVDYSDSSTILNKCTAEYTFNCSASLGCHYCWCNAETSDEQCCQDLTRDCPSVCGDGRCHREPNSGAANCCNPVCAAGCDGAGQADQCRACTLGHVLNGDTCESISCPPSMIENGAIVNNSDLQYEISGQCVVSCPRRTYGLDSIGECVDECPAGMMSVPSENGGMVCVECDKDEYCKECSASNSNDLTENCTLILGGLAISADPSGYPKLSTIQTIRGSLQMEKLTVDHFSSLSNLAEIGTDGDEVLSLPCYGGDWNLYSVFISENDNLISIDFSSLKAIYGGGVSMDRNPNLCIIGDLSLFVNNSTADICLGDQYRQSVEKCTANNDTCHPECNQTEGCWVSNSDIHCVSCANYVYEGRCVPTCEDPAALGDLLFTNESGQCVPCNDLCSGSCTGPSATDCAMCCAMCNSDSLFMVLDEDSFECVANCPIGYYEEMVYNRTAGSRQCMPCSLECGEDVGCTGPGNTLAVCDSCIYATINGSMNTTDQITCYEEGCPSGWYEFSDERLFDGKLVTNPCLPCDDICLECNAPGPFNCTVCTEGIALNMGRCFRAPESGRSEASDSSAGITGGVAAAVLVLILITVAIVMIIVLYKHQKLKKNYNKNQDGNARQLPSNERQANKISSRISILPDLVVSRDKLTLQESIGQGEFGIVYRANLLLDNSMRKTVAVKTIKGDYDQSELDSFLQESLLMRGISHSNVMQLIGICVDGDDPFIILPFMEGGPLLKYLRKSKDELFIPHDAVATNNVHDVRMKLLEVCLQIAQGMEYLEKLAIIHRDLAARNCMLESLDGPLRVRVADFGLSKGLYEKVYYRQQKNSSVKLPIKWLAIESIEYGLFTTKSDVWAYGITCWEVFTCGKIPYGGIASTSVLKTLKTGERMEQPDNQACTKEIYDELMLNCWKASPDERVTFAQMVKYLKGINLNGADLITCPAADLTRPGVDCDDEHIYI